MLRDRVVDVAWHPLQNVVVCVSGTTGQVSCDRALGMRHDHQSAMHASSRWVEDTVRPFLRMQRRAQRVLQVACRAGQRELCL